MTETHDNPPLLIFREISTLRDYRRQLLMKNESVALVPTMGALHDGHLSLIRQAAKENDNVFISIFVNPTQFGANEDLTSYPRTWDADLNAIAELNEELNEELAKATSGQTRLGKISGIFAPTAATMYPNLPPSSDPDALGSFVTITPLSSLLEGSSRPTFFRGVATVCMKLFNIITPDRVYFGQKDVQQTVIIKRMVKDFGIGTELRICPTVREADGLALSSRNVYLGRRRRRVGIVLYRALQLAEERYLKGERRREEILGPAQEMAQTTAKEQEQLQPMLKAGFEVDYISLADPDTLQEVDIVDESRGAVLSGAIIMLPIEEPQEWEDVGLGGGVAAVRLIDNIPLQPKNSRQRGYVR